jgi:hypothetical protein
MGDPWRARVWREQGTGGTYADMDPDVRPDRPEPPSAPQGTPYPEGANSREVMAWVGDDRARAHVALTKEEARETPRATITTAMRRLIER